MKHTLFISKNKHTTNIVVFDEDAFIEDMGAALKRKDGLTDSMQQEILSRAFSSYEVKNKYLNDFIEVFPGLKNIKYLDENHSQSYTCHISDRTDVTFEPILIPLDKINPNKPTFEAVIVHHKNGKNYYVGKHIKGQYTYDIKEVKKKENCIGVICNGIYVRKGNKMPMKYNLEEEDGMSM